MTLRPRASMAAALLAAIVLIAYTEAGRGGGRRGSGAIPCEIKHSNGTQLYQQDCIFGERGLYECRNKISNRGASWGRRRGNRRDSSEEQDSLAIKYCLPKQCETADDCPSGVECRDTKECRVTRAEYQIARSCNVTNAVTGAPLSAPRPCLFGKKCDNERREQIVYNGQDWLVSKCRRPRRGGRDSSSEEDSSEEELLTSTTTTITPDLPFQP